MPGMFGGGGDAAMQAAQAQVAAANQAAQIQKQMYEQARADVAPWRTAGTTAVGTWGDILAGKQDPTAILQNFPGYQWGLGQGVNARDLSAASRGLALSGAQQKGLTSYGTNYALQNAWNPYMSSLQALSGQGLQAGGMSGNWGMQAGQQMGQDYLLGGQAQAQGIMGQYQMDQANQNSWLSALGMGLGAVTAPMTGGTSLLGMGANAIGNWWGGGGGAPSYGWGWGANP